MRFGMMAMFRVDQRRVRICRFRSSNMRLLKRLARRVDHLAESFEEAVGSQKGIDEIDRVLLLLLGLWLIFQLWLLGNLLSIYPLF